MARPTRASLRTGARRIRFLAHAEILHVVRDRATLAQIIVMPLVQLLVLSNAATFQIRDTPAYVVDFDRSSVSRALASRFAASGHFRIVGYSAAPDSANDRMLRGDVTLIVTIPADFEVSLVRNRTAELGLAVNAEKGSAAGVVQSYAAQILAAYSDELGAEVLPISIMDVSGRADPPPVPGVPRVELRTRSWYNPTLNYKHYMVPGILVALVTMIGTLLTAQNIVREKEVGTLEQLNVTPISKAQFITAKMIPYWALALIDLALGLTVGHLAFGVPVHGSLLLLFGSAMIYLVVALAIGLWISTVVDTQQQAMFVAFFILMVYLLMSGLLTPIDSMPRWVQLLSELNPVRHFVTISRAVLVKGAGLTDVARPLCILVTYSAVTLVLAVRQYSKRTR